MTSTAARVVAEGQLVRLREKQVEDARRDYLWRRDPDLARYDAAYPITVSFRTFVTTLAEEIAHPAPHRRSYAIETLDGDRHIGNVMYYAYDPVLREAELGITIGDREYWSQGYGTDAVRAILRYLFERRGFHRLYLHTLSWNDRAQVAFERAGFRRLHTVYRDGYSFEYMEIRRDEYDPGRRRTGPWLPGRR